MENHTYSGLSPESVSSCSKILLNWRNAMKYKYLPHTTTGKPLISKAPPPYRPPAKWPWLLTVGLALLLQCLTIPLVYAELITNPNVEFINKVKAGTVTEEQMARVKYVRGLMIRILEKTSASADQKIQDVEWINKTSKGLIDLYGTASHIFGELKYLNRAPPNMRDLLNKHRQAAGNALGKLSLATLENLKKKFVSKETLDFYFGELGFLLEWSARTGDFEKDPFFNAGNFGFMNFVKEEELVQSYLNLVNIDNGVTTTNFIGTVALKVLGDLAQSGGGLEPSYYITNALGFAIDLASAKVLAEIAGQNNTDLAAVSFMEYYYVGYLGDKDAFYHDLGVNILGRKRTLEDAFSAFLQQNNLTSSFPQGLWSQFMGDAVSKSTALNQIRNWISNSALALRFDFELNPKVAVVTEKKLLLGKELKFYLHLDPILIDMGYKTTVQVVRLTKPNGQSFNVPSQEVTSLLTSFYEDNSTETFTVKDSIYTVKLDAVGEYQYEIRYAIENDQARPGGIQTVTMTHGVYATSSLTNTNPPAIESAELLYGNDGRYHLKVGLRLPDAVFYDPTNQYQFKPSSRNPLKLTVTNNVFFLQPEEKTAVVTEPGELVSFDLTFDEVANGSSVLSQSGELDNLSVSYELINSFILPEGSATAGFSLPIEYANLNPNRPVPYVEIRTKNNQSSSLTQGDMVQICPKNVGMDFKQWSEIGLAYRIDWPTPSQGILAGTLDGDCLKFVAKETGQHVFLRVFSMVNGQVSEQVSGITPVAIDLSGLIQKEMAADGSTTATTGQTPSVESGAQTSSDHFKQVSSGFEHTCALKEEGSIVCWGRNDYGQAMPPVGTFIQVSSGVGHTCALKPDGSLACWGYNYYGQTTSPTGSFTQVSSGGSHTCALKTDGSLACWGDNFDGQATPPAGSFTQVSSGISHTCALKTDGSLACWGYNFDGQATPPAGSFTQVSSGGLHTCALKIDGSLACWGHNSLGETAFSSGSFTQVSSGGSHTCALKIDGSLACWGDNTHKQITFPEGAFTQVSSGGHHSCALKIDDSLVCWGENGYGQITLPSATAISNNTTTQQPMVTPTILSVSPTTATLDTPTIFTLTGTNLVTGMGFTVADCEQTITDGFSNELAGGTDTQRQFQCIPRGIAGLKTGLVKDKPGGTVLHTFTVEVDGTSATAPQITSVTPTNAVIGATVTFTVTGTHLYEGMGFTVGDCVHSNIEVAGGTDTQRQFVCTQQGMNGNQRGLVKDFPGGNLLYRFNVETTGGADPSPVPEITPEPVAPPPAPPVIIYPPICTTNSATLDTTCHGNYQTLTGDHKVEKWANISNLVITGTVENEGWVSNTTIQAGATIKGGVLTGYITNEGTLVDIEFVGAVLKGGTLAGKIINNSRVGGKIQNVKLAAGTKITGGMLTGQIEGDCQQPALLENVKVKTGSVLKCVALGKNVKMEKGVTVEEK
jgi:alpha-tubulin suppressor-like RCC1 family protein